MESQQGADDRKFSFSMDRLRAIEPPAKKEDGKNRHVIYYDVQQPGLRFLVTSTGNKSYQFQMWSSKHGRPLTRTIAKFNKISLKTARKEAALLQGELTQGIDVETKIRDERRARLLDPTVAEFAERFLTEHLNKRTGERKKSSAADRAILENKVIPAIGSMKMSAVRRSDIDTIFENAQKKTEHTYTLKSGKTTSRTMEEQ